MRAFASGGTDCKNSKRGIQTESKARNSTVNFRILGQI